MHCSMGRAFPEKRIAILSTEEGVLTTSFPNWAFGAYSGGVKVLDEIFKFLFSFT